MTCSAKRPDLQTFPLNSLSDSIMEDQALSSMCLEPVSYCTFAEQREAVTQHKNPYRKTSRDHNSYICMIIPILCRHWVAVQITIAPFFLQQFPGQTFFSSQLRYGPCCCQIDHAETLDLVQDTVQKVIDSSYRSVCWDYSSSQCCILDRPTNTNIEQCIAVTKARFQAYTECHIEAPPSPPGQPNNITNHRNALDARSCSAGHAPPPSVIIKRKAGTGPTKHLITLPPTKKKQRISEEETDAKLVKSTALWLKAGLKKLSVESFPTLVTLSDILPTQPSSDEACTLASDLWELAGEVENVSAAVVWSMRYIAACSSLVGTVFASSSKAVKDLRSTNASRQSIHNWQGLVHIVNSIVDLMLPRWKDQAYLLYHVFAVKGHLLSGVARMSEAKRVSFASRVANTLGLNAPSGFERVSLFNPTRVLSSMLPAKSHEEICEAIWLPSAMGIGAIEGACSRRVEDLSILSVRMKLGHSNPNLSPSPTPETVQQVSSTKTDESHLVLPAEAGQSNNTLLIMHDTEHIAMTTDTSAANQAGDWHQSHPACSAASLLQPDATGSTFPETSILDTETRKGTRAPSPILNLDSDYDFDGSAFENSDFFQPLLNLSDGGLDGEE